MQEEMTDIEQALRIVCSYLNDNDMKYVVVGGIAVMYHGVPRTTVDINFILDLDGSQTDSFFDYLGTMQFDVQPKSMKELLQEGSQCTVFVGDSLLRLDLQNVNSNSDRMTLERAIQVHHLGIALNLGSLEDTLINKLLFQGEQDMRDALGIYTRHESNVDEEYIEKMCESLNILDVWLKFKDEYQQQKTI